MSTQDLTSVGRLFAEATGGATFDVDVVTAAAAEAFFPADLFSAGPTAHSAAMVDRCETALEQYRASGHKPPRATLAEYASWQRHLKVARHRDHLHAERQRVFPGCLCLGYGGRYPSAGLTVVTTDGRRLVDPEVTVFRDPCPCPLGVAAHAAIERRVAELHAADRARQRDRLWGALKMPPGLGSAITFATHPDQQMVGWVQRWYDGRGRTGLILHGPNQRGKTVTAYLLARQAIDDGFGTVGLTVPDLIERLTDTFTHDERLKRDPEQPPQTTHADLITSLQTIGFLVLDDLGAEKLTDYVERALFQILNARADQTVRTVITTNLSGKEIALRFGNRITARIMKMCETRRLDGPILGSVGDPTFLDDDPQTYAF